SRTASTRDDLNTMCWKWTIGPAPIEVDGVLRVVPKSGDNGEGILSVDPFSAEILERVVWPIRCQREVRGIQLLRIAWTGNASREQDRCRDECQRMCHAWSDDRSNHVVPPRCATP